MLKRTKSKCPRRSVGAEKLALNVVTALTAMAMTLTTVPASASQTSATGRSEAIEVNLYQSGDCAGSVLSVYGSKWFQLTQPGSIRSRGGPSVTVWGMTWDFCDPERTVSGTIVGSFPTTRFQVAGGLDTGSFAGSGTIEIVTWAQDASGNGTSSTETRPLTVDLSVTAIADPHTTFNKSSNKGPGYSSDSLQRGIWREASVSGMVSDGESDLLGLAQDTFASLQKTSFRMSTTSSGQNPPHPLPPPPPLTPPPGVPNPEPPPTTPGDPVPPGSD